MYNNSPRIVCSVVSLFFMVTTRSCIFPLRPCKVRPQRDLKMEIYVKKMLFFYVPYTYSHILPVFGFTFTSSVLSGRAAVHIHCSSHVPSPPAECVCDCFVWVLWKLSLWTSCQSRDRHRLKVYVSSPSTTSRFFVYRDWVVEQKHFLIDPCVLKGQKDITEQDTKLWLGQVSRFI